MLFLATTLGFLNNVVATSSPYDSPRVMQLLEEIESSLESILHPPYFESEIDRWFDEMEMDVDQLPSPVLMPPIHQQENLVFDLHTSRYGIPCIRGYLNGPEPNARERCFQIEFNHNLVYLAGSYADYTRDIVLVPSEGDETVTISRSQTRVPYEWRQFDDYMGIGHGSDFSDYIRRFMIFPVRPGVSGSQLRLVANPTNPENFCMDPHIPLMYPAISSSGTYLISATVSLRDTISGGTLSIRPSGGTSSSHIFSLSTEPLTILPNDIRSNLVDIMHSLGMVESTRGVNIFQSGCSRRMNQLPSLVFSFDRTDQIIVTIVMDPEDYLRIDLTTGECISQIHLGELDENEQLLFGRMFLERVGILIDYDDLSIGLCEPS